MLIKPTVLVNNPDIDPDVALTNFTQIWTMRMETKANIYLMYGNLKDIFLKAGFIENYENLAKIYLMVKFGYTPEGEKITYINLGRQ